MSELPALSKSVNVTFIPWSYAALGISFYLFTNAFIYALTKLWLMNKENLLIKKRRNLELENSISEVTVSKSTVLQVEDPTQESILADSSSRADSTQPSISSDSTTSQEETS
uniref:Neur_chan_memb domain-containing protein n=1 Tax=Meloidogyne hapla TaxID=6305 RepID=A0A1I8B204_MELHA